MAKKTAAKKSAKKTAVKKTAAKKAPAKKASAKAKAPAKKTATTAAPKKKTAAKKAGSGQETGFNRKLAISPELQAVIGVDQASRTEVTKGLWDYIKENQLQDQKNKRNINADDKLKAVFGKPMVNMFEMTKLIGKHLS